jgi:hypothetical protein
VDADSLVRRAFDAFKDAASVPPPMTLRGGNAVDGYDFPAPYDAAMVVEALVRSLRPPDRYPPPCDAVASSRRRSPRIPRTVAFGDHVPGLQEAQQALEEWWLPNPRSRPTPDARAHDGAITDAACGACSFDGDRSASASGCGCLPSGIRARRPRAGRPPSVSARRADCRRQPVGPHYLHGHAEVGDEVVTLTVRSWPRDDVIREVNRMVDSFFVGE